MSENLSDVGADSMICCAAILLWCVVCGVEGADWKEKWLEETAGLLLTCSAKDARDGKDVGEDCEIAGASGQDSQ